MRIKQVYEKAKYSFGDEEDFLQIETLYNNCNEDINKAKKKAFIKNYKILNKLKQ